LRLKKARVTNYRSVKDSGWIDFDEKKNILVGPNEAGKTALLRALQQINPPADAPKFDVLRDYPRKDYNDITTNRVDPSRVDVVVAHFALEDRDKAAIASEFEEATYVYGRRLDNTSWHDMHGGPERPTTSLIKKDLLRLAAHIDSRQGTDDAKSSLALEPILAPYSEQNYYVQDELATKLIGWLEKHYPFINEEDKTEEERYDRLLRQCKDTDRRTAALTALLKAKPVFVLFSNYYRVRPLIHLDHLATRIENNLLDDQQYDYGNQCLLKP
jgi:energy-coupling factor transporter ATP-binding protein EcfA2